MLITFIKIFIYTIMVAMAAFTVTEILMMPGMILSGWYDFLERQKNKCSGKMIWWTKPLGLCPTCFAGQCGFWLYFYFKTDYDVVMHLLFTLITLFFHNIIMKTLSNYGK